MTIINFDSLSLGIDFGTLNLSVSSTAAQTTTLYRYNSGDGDRIDFEGSAFGYTGNFLNAGIVGNFANQIRFDLGNNNGNPAQADLIFSNLAPLSAAAFNFANPNGLTERFFDLVIGGNDLFELDNVALPNLDYLIAGDGGNSASTTFEGGNDIFTGGSAALTGGSTVISGDLLVVLAGGRALGGNDVINVGATNIFGDFTRVEVGAIATGGNDRIAPVAIASPISGELQIFGDTDRAFGSLVGGNDIIDLSATDISAFSAITTLALNGDALLVGENAVVLGGNDRIIAPSINTQIEGDFFAVNGFAVGGNDTLFGGSGNDTLYGDTENVAANAFLRAGHDRIFGGSGNDLIYGDTEFETNNLIGGNDTIFGGSGFDTIFGGSGNDRIEGDFNADRLHGGIGNDTILGGQGLDQIFGEAGNDFLNGGTHDDRLFGGFGDDTILAGDGNDLAVGGIGNDYLNGFAGFDTLDGGAGNDTLTGAFNADRFVFENGFGNDIITDFDPLNDFEKIDLSGVTEIVDLADLFASHLQIIAGVVTIVDGINSITLLGIASTVNLDANDFIF